MAKGHAKRYFLPSFGKSLIRRNFKRKKGQEKERTRERKKGQEKERKDKRGREDKN